MLRRACGPKESDYGYPTYIYGDEIFTATDLNRRAGQVLDEAKNRPVTITRNDEAFALLPRKDACRMVEAVSSARRMVDLVTVVSTYNRAGAEVPVGQTFEWLDAFDMDELRGLVSEGYGVFHRAADAELSWTDFDAALHEWQESASALRSHALATAFATPFDEVSLTEPVTVECGDDV